MIIHALANKKLPVYGDGLQIRDWLHVEDHCRAIQLVMENGELGEVYNIGGHNEYTNVHIVKMIISFLQQNKDDTINNDLISFVTDRKGHDRRYAINPSKIINQLGWQQKIEFNEGIRKTVQWYLNNEEWLTCVLRNFPGYN
jgi:dTDP-glucose 4,6-dehydratase